MFKLTFKNKVLNIVTAGILLTLALIGLIGYLFVDEIDYLGKGLYYIIGVTAIVFAGINTFASLKKANQKGGNITIIVTGVITVILGFILLIHESKVSNGTATYSDDEFLFSPSHVFGLCFYIEGLMLILVSKFNETQTYVRTLIGIAIMTFGVISFIWLKDVHLVVTFILILLLLGLYYLFAGLKAIPKHEIEEVNRKAQEKKEKRVLKKAKKQKEDNKKIENDMPLEITLDEEKEENS